MNTFFYSNKSDFAGYLEEMLDEGKKKQPYRIFTILVGRQNYSSPHMFLCWVMVVMFHNILSFMIEKKISNVTMSICGKLYR